MKDCTIIIIILLGGIFLSCKDSSVKDNKDESKYDNFDYPSYPHYSPTPQADSSIINKKISSTKKDYDLNIVYYNATTADEAYEEGYDHGYEAGEEDGMNNDTDFSYDEDCPYKGKMLKKYREGYKDGYDEGLEDGLEEYNLTKEPWEEDTDW